jgi:hypothetical protein
MTARLARHLGLCACALSLTFVSSAHAEEPQAPLADDSELARPADENRALRAARDTYRAGSQLAREGHFASALERFRASFWHLPHAATLYNMSYCEERLDDAAGALRDLLAAVAFEDASPERALTAQQRERSELLRIALAPRVASLELEFDTPVTQLRVNGISLARRVHAGRELLFASPSRDAGVVPTVERARLVLNPGRHIVTWASAAGHGSSTVELRAGMATTLDFSSRKPAPSTAASDTSITPPAKFDETSALSRVVAPTRSDPLRTLGHTSLAVGGGLAAVGIGAGIIAAITKGELDSSCNGNGGCPPSQDQRIARFETATTVANVAVLSGVLFAGTGLTLLLLRSPPSNNTALRIRVNLGVEVSGAF